MTLSYPCKYPQWDRGPRVSLQVKVRKSNVKDYQECGEKEPFYIMKV